MSTFPDGLFQYGGVPVGDIMAWGAGHIYYVMQTTNANYTAFAAARTKTYNDDGSALLHTTIQSALDATVSERNDYVIVMADNDTYSLTSALTMTKDSVHLIAPAGMGPRVGASRAVRLYQATTATPIITVTGNSCEIAGFMLDAIAGVAASNGMIYCPTASAGQATTVHHNYFRSRYSSTDNYPFINSGAAGCWNWSTFSHNFFNAYIAGAGTVATYGCYLAGTGILFEHNIMTVQNGATITSGVRCNGAGNVVQYNTFVAHRAGGGLTAGAFGAAIHIDTNDVAAAIGNRGAVGTGTLIEGGTADTSWCDNRSAVDGGLVPVDQDIDT